MNSIVGCVVYADGRPGGGPADVAELYVQAPRTPGAVVWLGLHEPGEHELAEVTALFQLHPLAVKDVLPEEPRPKVQRYEDVVLVIRAAHVEHRRFDRHQRDRQHRLCADLFR